MGAGGGVDISSGELLRFDFATGVTIGTGGNNSITSGTLAHYNVNGFTTTVDNSGGTSALLITAYDANSDTNLTNDSGSKDTITQIYKNNVLLTLGLDAIASAGGVSQISRRNSCATDSRAPASKSTSLTAAMLFDRSEFF